MKLLSRASCFSFAAALAWFCADAALLRAAEEKPAAKKPLPSAAEILERYGKAVGGKESFTKHHSQHAKGTVDMVAQNLKGTMEVFAARPNKMLLKVTLPGIGETATGFDGKVAWMLNQLLGPMLLEGKQKAEIATQADFDHALHDPKHYTTMEVLGVEEFNGDECYKLKLVHRTGFASTEFFSVKTGLQRGFIATQETPLGAITATSTVYDYKQFGDLFMPSKISQKAMGMETIMTIEEMEYDKVDPTVFDLPAEVKTLLEQPAPEKTGQKPAEKPGLPLPAPNKQPSKQVEK